MISNVSGFNLLEVNCFADVKADILRLLAFTTMQQSTTKNKDMCFKKKKSLPHFPFVNTPFNMYLRAD